MSSAFIAIEIVEIKPAANINPKLRRRILDINHSLL